MPFPCPTLGHTGGELRHEPITLLLVPPSSSPAWHPVAKQSTQGGGCALLGVLQPLGASRVLLVLSQTQHKRGGNLCSHPVPQLCPLPSYILSRSVPWSWPILPTSAPHTCSHQLPATLWALSFLCHGTLVTRSRR